MLFNIIQWDELVLEWIITIVINLLPGNYQTIVKQNYLITLKLLASLTLTYTSPPVLDMNYANLLTNTKN